MARPKTFTLRGKRYRIDPKLPISEIQRVLDRYSVVTPDAVLVQELRGRMICPDGRGVKLRFRPGWSRRMRKQAYRYALYYMDKLRALYRAVQTGRC